MKREIMFRGKRKKSLLNKGGDWVYGGVAIKDGYALIIEVKPTLIEDEEGDRFIPSLTGVPVNEESVREYTKYTNEKGIKVFSGDIHRLYNGRLVKVEWNTSQYRWSLFYIDTDDIAFHLGEGEDIEPINKETENPELLEDQ